MCVSECVSISDCHLMTATATQPPAFTGPPSDAHFHPPTFSRRRVIASLAVQMSITMPSRKICILFFPNCACGLSKTVMIATRFVAIYGMGFLFWVHILTELKIYRGIIYMNFCFDYAVS